MKKKVLIGAILIAIVVIIGSLVFLGEDFKKEEAVLKPEYLEWFNSTAITYNFESPYVKCVFDKTCNGSFDLVLRSELNNPIEEIRNVLEGYGEIKEIRSFDVHKIYLTVEDMEVVNNFIDSPLFYEISISNLYSDYKIDVAEDELVSCNDDSDCIAAGTNCCSGSNCGFKSINRLYWDVWNSQFYCRFTVCTAVVCTLNKVPVCEDNKCAFSESDNCEINEDCMSTERGCINKSIAERFDYTPEDIFYCKCENDKCVEILNESETVDNTPLSILNFSIIDNSNLIDNSILVSVKTNKRAKCEYVGRWSAGFGGEKAGDILEFSEMNLIEMEMTNRKTHSQVIGGLLNDGYYTVKINCTDDYMNSTKGFFEFSLKSLKHFKGYINLDLAYKKNFIGGCFSSKDIITETELQNLFRDGTFEFEYIDWGTKTSDYTQSLHFGCRKIENSTSNSDLENSRVLIEVSTTPNNYLYKYRLSFTRNVNFSRMSFLNQPLIEILGNNYIIDESSTNQKIILNKETSDLRITLENNKPVRVDDIIVNGTLVEINDWGDGISGIEISFAMQDSNKDYIAVGEIYDNPVFQDLRVSFYSYSEEDGAKIYIGEKDK